MSYWVQFGENGSLIHEAENTNEFNHRLNMIRMDRQMKPSSTPTTPFDLYFCLLSRSYSINAL